MQSVSQPAAIATCKTESLHSENEKGCIHATLQLQPRTGLCAKTPESAARTFFSKYTTLADHSVLLFAAMINSIGSNHHGKISNSLQENIHIRTPIKYKVSQCRVNINATDVFLASLGCSRL
jgi:hypothetical protein